MTQDIQRIFDFVMELEKLKAVLRKTKAVGLQRYENSAEHSWQVCLLAQLLAERSREAIDVARVVEILLVHDIPEIDAGDQIVYDAQTDSRAESERRAAHRIFGMLPEPHASRCIGLWQEYEERETKEAIYAYAIDRLMPVLQNLATGGQSWRENRVPLEGVLGINSAIGKACPEVWEYVKELIAQAAAAGVFEHDAEDA